MSRAGLWGFALALLACAPATQPPVKVMALVLSKEGTYETRQVELQTVMDIVAMKGSVATLIGGARIVVDPNDPLLATPGLTDEQLAEVFLKGKGGEPKASYIDKNGVLWPADFHTWNMVSAYHAFERSFEYFQAIYDGKSTDELKNAKVYYFPTFILLEAGPTPQQDNALFFSPIQGFAVLPFDKLQKVPLSLNQGVIGHEYAHLVFNRRVYNGKAVPDPLVRWLGLGASTSALNLLKSVDEGLADFHAYGITCLSELGCNPRFLSHSFSDGIADARDFSKPDKCLSQGDYSALASLNIRDFQAQGLEYRVGTVLAASLYQAGNKAGGQTSMAVLQKAVLAAYNDPSPGKPGLSQLISTNIERPQEFKLAAVADAILAHITDENLRKLTCNELLDRMQLHVECPALPCAALPHCPANSSPGTACPDVTP